jgi:hypothetical protein
MGISDFKETAWIFEEIRGEMKGGSGTQWSMHRCHKVDSLP